MSEASFMEALASRVPALQPMFIRRNDPVHPRAAFNQVSETYEVAIQYERAPMPPADSAFYGQGRDALHTGTRMWHYVSLAIPEWQSVMGWPFAVVKTVQPKTSSQPKNHWFNPLRARTNIESPQAQSLGSLTSVQGQGSSIPSLSKITF